MFKSLYIRVVLAFIAAVVIGLIAAFILTSRFFEQQFQQWMEQDTSSSAGDIAVLLERTEPDRWKETVALVEHMKSCSISVYDRPGHLIAGTDFSDRIAADHVRQVLDGGKITVGPRNLTSWIYGMPVQQSGERYAVFIRPTYPLKAVDFRKALQLHVITVLVVGGLFMLLVASYLVKPLNMLTKATRRLAKGDFDVQMELNRTDEIGVLSASFNEMTFELRRLEQMRQDFVSNVSHEIQTPLTSIIGFTKALRSAEMPEEERLYYLDIIQSESERISRLSDNLLRLASLESEHHPFHKSTFRLDEQIRRIVVVCEPVWSQKELQIELDLPKTTIAGDPDLLSQVWMNLLGNSIKFTPEGGRIGLRIEAELSSVKVSISDTGAGIPEHEHAMIFHQFYKGDPSRSDSTGGSGLGLAIVKKIVSLHKGTIVVESQAGEGTRMTVILPSIA